MTKTEAIARVFEIVSDIQCVHKTDVAGTGYYDVSQNESGYSINRYLGEDAEHVAYRLGIHALQFSDHGAGRKSVQAFGPESQLLADVAYIPRVEVTELAEPTFEEVEAWLEDNTWV